MSKRARCVVAPLLAVAILVPGLAAAQISADQIRERYEKNTKGANLDDFVPEHFDYLMERLFAAGALDVSLQHVQMKRNRPGFLVRVLARPAQRRELAELLFADSSAIGVRTQEWDRLVLPRVLRRVATPYGRIGVKQVQLADGRSEVSAEYDDCKRAARRNGVPLRDVIRAAEAAARTASGERG